MTIFEMQKEAEDYAEMAFPKSKRLKEVAKAAFLAGEIRYQTLNNINK